MDTLNIISYGGIAILIVLLVIFELKDRQLGNHNSNSSYLYYTHNNVEVRIRHLFSSRYKVYINGWCPVQTKRDRYGTYFTLKARSAADVEYQIDELYRHS